MSTLRVLGYLLIVLLLILPAMFFDILALWTWARQLWRRE